VSLYDKTQQFLLEDMLWQSWESQDPAYNNVKRFGPHMEDGSYFDLDLFYLDFDFTLSFASDGDAFVMELNPLQKGRCDIDFYISPLLLWGKEGTISAGNDTVSVKTAECEYTIKIEGCLDSDVKIYTELLGIPVKADKSVRLLCNISSDTARRLIKEKRAECEKTMHRSGGWLKDASDVMWKALIWNTIYEPVKERICVPVSRAWCRRNGRGFGSYVLFEWDTFFASLMGAALSKQTAYQQIEAICAEVTDAGMIPNFGSQRGGSPDRSQPPVGSYCVLKLYRQFGDRVLLEKYYPLLLKWNRWWFKHRDGNGDGLLEWGSDPIPDGVERGFYDNGGTMLAAMYESGLDNSPMYDDVTYNEGTHTMELNDVGLNALYALDCQSLASMAEILGRDKDAEELSKEYDRMKELINSNMYDSKVGMYCNTFWDGKKDYRFSPTNFYPLLAGIANPEQATAMIERHLLNEDEFWGEFIIPSIAKNAEGYYDQDYWRGRIWGPMNYLVYEGLRRAGKTCESRIFAEKSFDLFMREWENENHIHENYNSITGDGDDKINADPFYTWGALLAYLPVCEYIYISPEGYTQFGNTDLPGAVFNDFPMTDANYSLDTMNGFSLRRNGKDFIISDTQAMLSDYINNNGEVSFTIQTSGKEFVIAKQDDIESVKVSICGKEVFNGKVSEVQKILL